MTAIEGRLAAGGGMAGIEQRRPIVRFARRNPRVCIFGGLIVALALVALAAPLISPGHPTKASPRERTLGPSATHPLGTDPLGRDTLTRVFYGARVSLLVGAISVVIGLSIGSILGTI